MNGKILACFSSFLLIFSALTVGIAAQESNLLHYFNINASFEDMYFGKYSFIHRENLYTVMVMEDNYEENMFMGSLYFGERKNYTIYPNDILVFLAEDSEGKTTTYAVWDCHNYTYFFSDLEESIIDLDSMKNITCGNEIIPMIESSGFGHAFSRISLRMDGEYAAVFEFETVVIEDFVREYGLTLLDEKLYVDGMEYFVFYDEEYSDYYYLPNAGTTYLHILELETPPNSTATENLVSKLDITAKSGLVRTPSPTYRESNTTGQTYQPTGYRASGNYFLNPLLSILIPIFCFSLLVFLVSLGRERLSKTKFRLPVSIRIKTFIALTFSLLVLGTLYFILYFIIHPMAFWIIGVLPIVILMLLNIKGSKGIDLKEKDAPKLFRMLKDISKKTGVSIPNKVTLEFDSGIGVVGLFRRKLSLGMGGITHLSSKELYSILLHEFGHFKGYDNIIGSFLLYVSAALGKLTRITSYFPTIYGLAVYIFTLFYKVVFDLTMLAYSRQREYSADILAARIGGSKLFGKALENYSTHAFIFQRLSPIGIIKRAKRNERFSNIYKSLNNYIKKTDPAEIAKVRKKISREKGSLFSTHPPIRDRKKNIKGIKKPKSVKLPGGKAVKLIKKPEKKQEKLTKIYTDVILDKVGDKLKDIKV